jgi:hypothetical protein
VPISSGMHVYDLRLYFAVFMLRSIKGHLCITLLAESMTRKFAAWD